MEHLRILKHVGLTLVVLGVIDIGLLIYCIANQISYSSSLNIFAVVAGMLVKVAPEPNFRARLDQEARELTRIGNNFRIRHSETSQRPLQLDEHVDYLFHRMFSLISMMLKVTYRGG